MNVSLKVPDDNCCICGQTYKTCRHTVMAEQYTTVEITNPYVKVLESHRKLIREAVEDFNRGLNIGLGWVARAERLLGDDE